MYILSSCNQKGGVGKTTSAVTIAAGLAMQHVQVLLVDLDAQGNCADALGIEKRPSIHRLLSYDELDITENARPRLDVITGDKKTVATAKLVASESFSEYKLRNTLLQFRGKYDVIILDTAPGAGVLQINALVASTHFLVPISLAHLATVGAVDILGTVASLKKVGAFRGKFMGVLPTLWDRTTNESQKQLTEMAKYFRENVFPPIPVDVKAREAPAHGKTLYEYAPHCRALVGIEMDGTMRGGYNRVIQRILKELI